MKFTVTFVALLSISSTWAVLAKRVDDSKDKREAPSSYGSSSSGHSASNYQSPSSNHGDANSINVGAAYSIGGAKPSFDFGGHGSGAGLQLGAEGLQSGHSAYQLAPITLQPHQGIIGTDLSQIMNQLSHSLNSGALSLQPSNTVAEFHDSGHGAQALSFPQFQQYANPKIQQYALAGSIASAPSYAAGTKGLSSYGATGPVLFNPSQGNGQAAGLAYAVPSAGHSVGDAGSLSLGGAGHSFGGLSLGGSGQSLGGAALLGGSGHSLGGLGHSLAGSGLSFDGSGYSLSSGQPLGGSGHAFGHSGYSLGSLGGLGHSLGGSPYSFGDAGQSLGAYSFGGSGLSHESAGQSAGDAEHSSGGSKHSSGSSSGHSKGGSAGSHGSSGHSHGSSSGSSGGSHYKVASGSHGASGKSAFKPSTFLGASLQSDSGSYGASSFPQFSGGSLNALSFDGHGSNFGSFGGFGGGSSKFISPLYTKAEGSLDSAAAYSSIGHLSSPPGTTYGFPTSSYPAGAIHAASSGSPQYYISSSKYPGSFGEGSSSYRGPSSSHSSLSSHSSGPKYSFGSPKYSSGSRYASPKDSHGAHSETSYNTIKYSEELKPRIH